MGWHCPLYPQPVKTHHTKPESQLCHPKVAGSFWCPHTDRLGTSKHFCSWSDPVPGHDQTHGQQPRRDWFLDTDRQTFEWMDQFDGSSVTLTNLVSEEYPSDTGSTVHPHQNVCLHQYLLLGKMHGRGYPVGHRRDRSHHDLTSGKRKTSQPDVESRVQRGTHVQDQHPNSPLLENWIMMSAVQLKTCLKSKGMMSL